MPPNPHPSLEPGYDERFPEPGIDMRYPPPDYAPPHVRKYVADELDAAGIGEAVVTPEMFGAVGDGIADDTAALAACFAEVSALGRGCVALTGLYLAAEPIEANANALALRFLHPGHSGLYFPETDGLSVRQSHRYASMLVENLLVLSGGACVSTGFRYENTVPATGDQGLKRLVMPVLGGRDRLKQTGQHVQGWRTAVEIVNGDRFVIDQPYLQGPETHRQNGFPAATTAVFATGSTHLVVRDPSIFCFETAVQLRGASEGVELLGGSLVANKRGFDQQADAAPANDVNIRGVHIASSEYNINLGAGGAVSPVMHTVEGCLLFCRTEAYVAPDFTHIITAGQAQITGNYFFTAANLSGAGHTAVDVRTPAHSVQMQVNQLSRVGKIARIAAGSAHNQIAGNHVRDDAASLAVAPVDDAGSNTVIAGNVGDRRFGAAWAGRATWSSGTGAPEGVVTAPAGSLYTRQDGGAGTTLYVKESGAGATGWAAK